MPMAADGGRLWPQGRGRRLLGWFELSETQPARASCLVRWRTGGSGRSVAREVRLTRAWDRCSKA